MKVLVTGDAGFIGFHTAKRLLERGDSVVGFDVLNDYYDPSIKKARRRILEETAAHSGSAYQPTLANLADRDALDLCFDQHEFDRVIHLAAQAGVRYSLTNPQAYVESNLVGFANMLEVCRHHSAPHLTYASTSSVYGGNTKLPFSEHDGANHPLQFYAATKRANELMAHSYSHLYRLPTTALRFFTVYGPWGRPDMALFLFTKSIREGKPIQLFNYGNHTRDFTYVDDIVSGVILASDHVAEPNQGWDPKSPDPASSSAPYRVFNIGNNNPVSLSAYIDAIEAALGKKAIRNVVPLQPGDVPDTFADVTELVKHLGYKPATSVTEGVTKFVEWYQEYYPA